MNGSADVPGAAAPASGSDQARSRRRWVAATAVALYAVSAVSISSGWPKVTSPFPLLVFLPAFLLGKPLAPAITPLAFLAWSNLGRLGPSVPTRSKIAFPVLVALDAWLLVAGIRYGRQFEGDAYVVGVIALDAAWWAAIVATYVRNRRHPGFASNLWCHAIAFAWLGFTAFPYLGELP